MTGRLTASTVRQAFALSAPDKVAAILARADILTWRDAAGRTVLHYAAATAMTDTVATLLDRGFSVYAADGNGVRPIDISRAFGHAAVCHVMEVHHDMHAPQDPLPYATLADIRAAGAAAGVNMFEDLIRAGYARQLFDLARRDATGLQADDLLSPGRFGRHALAAVIESDMTHHMAIAAVWYRRPADFYRVWESVPDFVKGHFDAAAFSHTMRRMRIDKSLGENAHRGIRPRGQGTP